ncbi:hypothetical protein FQA39_LY01953 [Lamprigera yunnana]|nr:hypothetical protein FQA39_LY01953 [Lamprigera yunnana]
MNDGKRKRTYIGEDDERQNPIRNKIVEEETEYTPKTGEDIGSKQGIKLRTSPYEHQTGATCEKKEKKQHCDFGDKNWEQRIIGNDLKQEIESFLMLDLKAEERIKTVRKIGQNLCISEMEDKE